MENERVNLSIFEQKGIEVFIKREDKIDPWISGNKYWKLKYNLSEARLMGQKQILTFGGAFSNHIAATAAAGKKAGFETIGIIRGEELSKSIAQNPTLKFAASMGMRLHFVSRSIYRDKNCRSFLFDLKNTFGDFYLIPEGGSNILAVKGCKEIIRQTDHEFDYVALPVGTGATMAGVVEGSSTSQKVLGFPALKGEFLKKQVQEFTQKGNWDLITGYEFGGYGKVTSELIEFINAFKKKTKIPLDPIYTGKMMYGLFHLVELNYFNPGDRILLLHTGGLQGIAGINELLKRKKLPLIAV